jgi:hypothetical protein
MYNFPGVEPGDYIECHLKKTRVSLFG